MRTKLFSLGQCGITPAAHKKLESVGIALSDILERHQTGVWQDMSGRDQTSNHEAIQNGSRVFSAYKLTDDIKVWIITEADRSSTTILLPSEY